MVYTNMTSKSLKTKCLIAAATCLIANQCFAWGLAGGYVHANPESEDYSGLDFDMNGLTGSIHFADFDSQLAPSLNAIYMRGKGDTLYGELEADYFEGTGTLGYMLYNPPNFTLRLTFGLGLGVGDLKLKTNNNQGDIDSNATFAVLPVGLEANYLVPNTNLSFFGGATYKYYMDVSEARSRCIDGTSSSTSGYRACEGHGGISFDSDFVSGDLTGWQFAIGGKLYF